MNYLILVNKFEPLPAGFADSIKLKEVCGRFFESQTAECLEQMLSAASSDGIGIGVLSGYRSEDYQQMLWEKEVSREMGKGRSYEEAKAFVGKTLALPGCSEHSTGLAADLCTPSADDVEPLFHKTPQGKWLCCHAHEYGFILRYPRLKEHITGIDHEPWHYRYVGQEAARLITESGICLEEFLHFYSDKYTTC
ncbi:M15 family metallopeptidase [uncultured Ruminococcus sp.]|uniref:M15 family metallopeptidase n=1 Tax=uncultured Ruminococcus sp. TaxID=165186 RepID=UPI0025DF29EB|nr:M15 family metallopeptidase [uncultured Ruminococcus sp.]